MEIAFYTTLELSLVLDITPHIFTLTSLLPLLPYLILQLLTPYLVHP